MPVHELRRLSDGRLYFTMKQIKGHTLSDLIDELVDNEPEENISSLDGQNYEIVVALSNTKAFLMVGSLCQMIGKKRPNRVSLFGLKVRTRRDSNPQPSDPKSDALSN